MKCEMCNEKKATYECIDCGSLYCKECAIEEYYECDCKNPQNIYPIKKKNTNKI